MQWKGHNSRMFQKLSTMTEKTVSVILQKAKDPTVTVKGQNHQKDPDADTVIRCKDKYLGLVLWEELEELRAKLYRVNA